MFESIVSPAASAVGSVIDSDILKIESQKSDNEQVFGVASAAVLTAMGAALLSRGMFQLHSESINLRQNPT